MFWAICSNASHPPRHDCLRLEMLREEFPPGIQMSGGRAWSRFLVAYSQSPGTHIEIPSGSFWYCNITIERGPVEIISEFFFHKTIAIFNIAMLDDQRETVFRYCLGQSSSGSKRLFRFSGSKEIVSCCISWPWCHDGMPDREEVGVTSEKSAAIRKKDWGIRA